MKIPYLPLVRLHIACTFITANVAFSQAPNVVLIVADDLGYADVSFTMDYAMDRRNSPGWDPTPLAEVHTPNIDRLAAQSAIFTNGYVNGNVCSPTRAALMLGRYQSRVGIYDSGTGGTGMRLYEEAEHSLSGIEYIPVNPWIPEFLKQSLNPQENYLSGVFGKWHLGVDSIYRIRQGQINKSNAIPDKIDFSYADIGNNFEEPVIDSPVLNMPDGFLVDPNWENGSPWHAVNKGFDRAFFFMGRGGHSYWDPNNIYDNYDPDHPFRRTFGLNPRHNPGTGNQSQIEVPTGFWDSNASDFQIHPERIPENHLTHRITVAAGDFIEEGVDSGKPFFAYVAYNAPHSHSQTPYHFDPSTQILDRIGNDTRRLDPLDPATHAVHLDWADPTTPDPDWFPDPIYYFERFRNNPDAFTNYVGSMGDRHRCITLAMIAWMDKGVGEILQRLRDPNQDGSEDDSVYENTIVIFISDNGGAVGMSASNAPLRGNKSSNWEGGLRVPFIFSWPTLLKQEFGINPIVNDIGYQVANSRLIESMICAIDILPTLLDINSLGVIQPDSGLIDEIRSNYDYTPDGKSLLPLIRGEVDSLHDYLFWSRIGDIDKANGVVRDERWKLHIEEDGTRLLYDLDSDIGETNNLIDDYPAVVRDLSKAYFDYMNLSAVSSRQPVPNSLLITETSELPYESENIAVDYFDYTVGEGLDTGYSGGQSWVSSWEVTKTGNARIDDGDLVFNDPQGNYVDTLNGSLLSVGRSEIVMNRGFSSVYLDQVYFSCLIENLDQDASSATHEGRQRWQFHPNNEQNTYIKIGEGNGLVSELVVDGESVPFDVAIDLDTGTYLLVLGFQANQGDGSDERIRAWLIPAGTPIPGYSVTDLDTAAGGSAHIDHTADLWSGNLNSIGLHGDAVVNNNSGRASIDNLRVTKTNRSTSGLIASVLSQVVNPVSESTFREGFSLHQFTSDESGQFVLEFDEKSGWFSEEDFESGLVIERTSSLMPSNWQAVSPVSLKLVDWFKDQKIFEASFDMDGSENGFFRITNPTGF